LLISQLQIIPLDEMKKLLDLVWHGFAVYLLQIDHLSHLWMNKDVMTAADARQAEAEGFNLKPPLTLNRTFFDPPKTFSKIFRFFIQPPRPMLPLAVSRRARRASGLRAR
ncbi:MAG TPA: hypothetical protein VGB61_15555, partial [Pyrinomonadaceae bacterium]